MLVSIATHRISSRVQKHVIGVDASDGPHNLVHCNKRRMRFDANVENSQVRYRVQ